MKMIGHQTIGMNPPTGLGAGLPERLKKKLPIRIILENRFTPIAVVHHLVNRPGALNSELTSHFSGTLNNPQCEVKYTIWILALTVRSSFLPSFHFWTFSQLMLKFAPCLLKMF